MNIKTEYWPKPIPDRSYDWSAVDDDTYDGPGCPVGYGFTEQAAILDLREQLKERPGRCQECGNRVDHGDDLCGACAQAGREVESAVNDSREERL
jgi:hypothetical protein